MEKYNEEGGQELKRYLKRFELYCQENIRGGDQYWINELEEHLEGRILENFKLLRDYDDEYTDVKYKLTKWYKDNAEIRKRRRRKKFVNAKQKERESLYIFSIRLQSLFKTAYSNKNPEKSTTLIKQFKQAISRSAREMINTQIMAPKLKNEKPNWSFIQRCVRLREADDEAIDLTSDCSIDSQDGNREVYINLGRSARGVGYGRVDNRNSYDRNDRQNKGDYRNDNYKYQNNNSKREVKDFSRYRDENRNTAGKPQGDTRNQNYFRNTVEPPVGKLCYSCNRFGHISRDCRFRLGLCIICGERGHFARDCPKRRVFNRSSSVNRSLGQDFRGCNENKVNRSNRSQSHDQGSWAAERENPNIFNQRKGDDWMDIEGLQVRAGRNRINNKSDFRNGHLDVGLGGRVDNKGEVLGAVGGHWDPNNASNSYLN